MIGPDFSIRGPKGPVGSQIGATSHGQGCPGMSGILSGIRADKCWSKWGYMSTWTQPYLIALNQRFFLTKERHLIDRSYMKNAI